MAGEPTSPRIAPIEPADEDEVTRDLLGSVRSLGTPASNVFATLVRHPGLFRHWLPFAGKLLVGKLPGRERELLILRTAWRCWSEYEWGQHTLIARQSGLDDAVIERVKEGPTAPGWDRFDAALLTAVDELHDDSRISDTTWAALAERYDERQLLEVTMLVGQYHMLAFALNSAGVQREPGVPGFDG